MNLENHAPAAEPDFREPSPLALILGKAATQRVFRAFRAWFFFTHERFIFGFRWGRALGEPFPSVVSIRNNRRI